MKVRLDCRQRGFALIEVVLALLFVAGLGMAASAAALALIKLVTEARAEAAGVTAAASRLEELLAASPAARLAGHDVVVVDTTEVTRIWHIVRDDPAAGLSRIEVTARWDRPSITGLVLVGVAP